MTAPPAEEAEPMVEIRCRRCQKFLAVLDAAERYLIRCPRCGQRNERKKT